MITHYYLKLKNEISEFDLYIKLKEHPLVKKWIQANIDNFLGENNLSKDKELEKSYCFHGHKWNSASRSLSVLCEEMNFAISIVNQEMNPLGYPYIDLHFSLDKLEGDEYRNMMNEIHHHFEKLIGQVWDVSDWFKMTEGNILSHWAITQLNNICHEIEMKMEKNDFGYIFLSYNGYHQPNSFVRQELSKEDYTCFETKTICWGDLTAYYSQLGKTHQEAYNDNDDYIAKDNISNIRYITGESICNLVMREPNTAEVGMDPLFKEWLIKNGWDPADKTLGLGTCILGSVDLEKYSYDWEELDTIIKEYDNVIEVGFLEDDTIVYSKRYESTWQEQRNYILAPFNV